MKANVGSSVNSCPKTAGAEAAAKAKQGMEQIKMVFAYASCEYDLDAVLAGIADEMPGIPVIGNTSFTGVITPEGFISSDDGFAAVMAVAEEGMCVGIASVEKDSLAVEDGERAARLAMERAGKTTPPDYYYMVAPPAEEEFYVKGITNVIGRVPFFGGSAADNTISGNWKLFTDKGIFADGVAVYQYRNEK